MAPEEVTLGQVIEVIDGPIETVQGRGDGGKGSERSPAANVLSQTWKDVASAEREMLHAISLADLVERIHGHDEHMYFI